MRKTYRIVVIGVTGQGDFGHDQETAFAGLAGAATVAVADPDERGAQAAAARAGANQAYTDYREMLARERPDIAVVAPSSCEQRLDMVTACVEAGVKGILCEKPIAASLAEADAIVELCERRGVRLAVAHRRMSGYELHAKGLVEDGVIGEIQVMRGHGKGDRRSGAFDLAWVGTHILDSMRWFAGSDVLWANGHVTQDGQDATPADVREGERGIGPIAGNGLAAYYTFQNGVTAHYESYAGDRPGGRWLGFEIYGTKGILSVRDSPRGELYLYPHGVWLPDEADGKWERIWLEEWEKRPDGGLRPEKERTHESNRWIAQELLRAVDEDRELEKVSSGRDALAVLEMIMAVHESHREKRRVYLPLERRTNPYADWTHDEERAM